MFDQKDALVRLLRDNDPDTVSLVKRQLAAGGIENIPDLRELVCVDDENVSRHAQDIVDEIELTQAQGDFALLCHLFAEDGDVEQACWMLARAMMPGVDIGRYQRIVNEWGHELSLRLCGSVSARERVGILASYMASDLQFGGNSDDYYNLNNSLLPHAIDTRLGIPISLSILYIIVARRAGMKVDGINLPGHFIVRHGDVLLDPFHRGRIVSQADCEWIVVQQKLKWSMSFLEAASPRLTLVRILANLLGVSEDNHQPTLHKRVAGWLRALQRP